MACETEGISLHATCVAVDGRSLLIVGASGRGKSALALQMIALGARLVSDDIVRVRADGTGHLVACAPPGAQREAGGAVVGRIEARGVGILDVPALPEAVVVARLDLDMAETERLPPASVVRICGVDVATMRRVDGPHFAASLVLHLRGSVLAASVGATAA